MKKIASVILIMIMLTATPQLAASAADAPSDWAKADVDDAVSLGFVPQELQNDYAKDITRAEFAKIAVYFVAMQYNSDWDYAEYLYEKANPDYQQPTTPLTDSDDIYVNSAYALGIVNGRGSGIFDPDAPITRQEAAIMLMNTYRVYTGTAAADQSSGNFSSAFGDASTVADWALSDAETLWGWNVMQGVGGNLFDPLGYYTREQCFSTFMRLYRQAPLSRYYGKALCPVSYDQLYDEIKNATVPSFLSYNVQEFDTPLCTALYVRTGGTPHGEQNLLYILYKNGGKREIYGHMPKDPNAPPLYNYDIENIKISDDQKTLTFTITGSVGKIYSVDLATGTITVLIPSQSN